MGFYFIVHTLLGAILGSASWLAMQGKSAPLSVPLWVHQAGHFFQLGAAAACLLAILTSFINYSLVWAGVTVAEIFLGMTLSSVLAMKFRALLVVSSVLSIPIIMGALWKFWYI